MVVYRSRWLSVCQVPSAICWFGVATLWGDAVCFCRSSETVKQQLAMLNWGDVRVTNVVPLPSAALNMLPFL